MIAMCFNLAAAFLALAVLKPMRVRHFAAGPGPDALPAAGIGVTRAS